jgi:hypothetical protein
VDEIEDSSSQVQTQPNGLTTWSSNFEDNASNNRQELKAPQIQDERNPDRFRHWNNSGKMVNTRYSRQDLVDSLDSKQVREGRNDGSGVTVLSDETREVPSHASRVTTSTALCE